MLFVFVTRLLLDACLLQPKPSAHCIHNRRILHWSNQIFKLLPFIVFKEFAALLFRSDGQNWNLCILVTQQKKDRGVNVIGANQADQHQIRVDDF